jgi:hypothetical protein
MKTSVRKGAIPPHRSVPRSNDRRLAAQHPRRRILSLVLAARITLPHFSVSSAISLPGESGEEAMRR